MIARLHMAYAYFIERPALWMAGKLGALAVLQADTAQDMPCSYVQTDDPYRFHGPTNAKAARNRTIARRSRRAGRR